MTRCQETYPTWFNSDIHGKILGAFPKTVPHPWRFLQQLRNPQPLSYDLHDRNRKERGAVWHAHQCPSSLYLPVRHDLPGSGLPFWGGSRDRSGQVRVHRRAASTERDQHQSRDLTLPAASQSSQPLGQQRMGQHRRSTASRIWSLWHHNFRLSTPRVPFDEKVQRSSAAPTARGTAATSGALTAAS